MAMACKTVNLEYIPQITLRNVYYAIEDWGMFGMSIPSKAYNLLSPILIKYWMSRKYVWLLVGVL